MVTSFPYPRKATKNYRGTTLTTDKVYNGLHFSFIRPDIKKILSKKPLHDLTLFDKG